MICENSDGAVLSDPKTLSAALLLLAAFVLYSLYERSKSAAAAERRRLYSLLPTITPNFWRLMTLLLKLGFLSPRDYIPFFQEVTKQNGSLYYAKVFALNYVFINDPEDLKVLLSSTHHITKGPEYKILQPWLNTGLLTSANPKWHSRRKMLTNAFHLKVLETYLPSINKYSRSLTNKLISESENGNKPIADIESYITLCALDIIGETVMGVNLATQEGKSADYVKSIKKVSNILIKRLTTFWYWIDPVFYVSRIGREFRKHLKSVHEYTENIIKERRAVLDNLEHGEKSEENGKKRVYSFLDLLIGIAKDNPGTMTDKDIREEVDTFLFEGHDTSSIAMTMAIVHLGLDQNIQNSVRDELREIFGDSDRDATMEDLKAMSTLGRVIKETMRLYPSVSIFSRILNEPLYLKNYKIPENTIIGIVPHLLHRVETIYPDPERFDPNRFTPEQCVERHPYAYIPFSAGPRNCIGQKFAMYKMKIVVSTILRYARLETLGKQSDIVISAQLVLRADHLPDVKITPIYEK